MPKRGTYRDREREIAGKLWWTLSSAISHLLLCLPCDDFKLVSPETVTFLRGTAGWTLLFNNMEKIRLHFGTVSRVFLVAVINVSTYFQLVFIISLLSGFSILNIFNILLLFVSVVFSFELIPPHYYSQFRNKHQNNYYEKDDRYWRKWWWI